MSSRAGLRLLRATQPIRASFRQPFRRRIETAAETAAPKVEPAQTGFQRIWNSPVGPKTVHFWAPIMKWSIVLAGIADLARPAENLSLTQNLALVATGAIWTRWCLIIKPRNVFLATVNFFLLLTGSAQVTRILLHNRAVENGTAGEEIKSAGEDIKGAVEGTVADAKAAVEKAVK